MEPTVLLNTGVEGTKRVEDAFAPYDRRRTIPLLENLCRSIQSAHRHSNTTLFVNARISHNKLIWTRRSARKQEICLENMMTANGAVMVCILQRMRPYPSRSSTGRPVCAQGLTARQQQEEPSTACDSSRVEAEQDPIRESLVLVP